jgi:hypothetical protein
VRAGKVKPAYAFLIRLHDFVGLHHHLSKDRLLHGNNGRVELDSSVISFCIPDPIALKSPTVEIVLQNLPETGALLTLLIPMARVRVFAAWDCG